MYRVTITQVDVINLQAVGSPEWKSLHQTTLQALDASILSFARFLQQYDEPAWFVTASALFSAVADGLPLNRTPFVARRGIHASLKCCLAGTVLVADMSVNTFLYGGSIIDIIKKAVGTSHTEDLYNLSKQEIDVVNAAIKGVKVKLIHIGHSKKASKLGPAANAKGSEFEYEEEKSGKKVKRNVTVAQYFEIMGKANPTYREKLGKDGKLKFPLLPTINVGTDKHPVLIPAEFVFVPGGQLMRQNANTPQMVAEVIKYAAVRPDERMKTICNGEGNDSSQSVLHVLKQDPTAKAFGTANIDPVPMAVPAHLLPPPKLQYQGSTVNPGLEGSWNIDRPKQQRFVRLPPNPIAGKGYTYGLLVVSARQPSQNWADLVREFCEAIEKDAAGSGLQLTRGGPPLTCGDRESDIRVEAEKFMKFGAKIVFVFMNGEVYGKIKIVTDEIGLVTQCIKWKNLERPPRGFHLNVVLKVNTKLGGTNHTLASRLSTGTSSTPVFQDPPASIGWVFDKPTMLVGLDVSHPEKGMERPSMAAVVASMDGRLNQYAAHLSAQTAGQEMIGALEDAMCSLFDVFKARNGNRMPEHIIVYRDGVSEGQFPIVLEKELPQIQGAIMRMGYTLEAIKITIMVCQKRHQTRIVYEEKGAGSAPSTFINPCPGLVVDARGGNNTIVSATYNEFYLNSHVAIQGTSKPCKYSLLYDQIGFRLSELELLTYWTTYLYIRCNRSVSYATPAYYAHWASKRCKDLAAVGATDETLSNISKRWSRPGIPTTMFFL
jgi:eukaryotic translation initiation factor 2C